MKISPRGPSGADHLLCLNSRTIRHRVWSGCCEKQDVLYSLVLRSSCFIDFDEQRRPVLQRIISEIYVIDRWSCGVFNGVKGSSRENFSIERTVFAVLFDGNVGLRKCFTELVAHWKTKLVGKLSNNRGWNAERRSTNSNFRSLIMVWPEGLKRHAGCRAGISRG